MAAVVESAAKLIPAGSILCVVRGMILAHSFPVALTRREVAINQDMKALVLAMPAWGEFVLRACQAARARVLASVERSTHGTCRLDGEVVENLLIALPPLAEQKRIVAKVDQLMALCDDLEARQTKKREIGTRLTKSALDALTPAESPAELNVAWKRVVDNFDVLIDRSDRVKTLRNAMIDPLSVDSSLIAGQSAGSTHLTSSKPMRARSHSHRVGSGAASSPLRVRLWTACTRRPGTPLRGFPQSEPRTWSLAGCSSRRLAWLTKSNSANATDGLSREKGTSSNSREGERLGIAACVPPGVRVCLSQRMMLVRVRAPLIPQFVMWAMNSSFVLKQAVGDTGGSTSPHINMRAIRRFLVPIPPPEEQQRIVARVEAFMRTCDNLEAKLQRAETRAAKLVEAAVQELVA